MRYSLITAILASLFLVACSDRSPEERRAALHLPPPGFKGDAVQGRALFTQHCAVCHGRAGTGTDQGPPLVHAIYKPAHHADLAFQLAMKNGVKAHHWQFGDMKPQPDITPEMTTHIIAYVRQEQRKANIQ